MALIQNDVSNNACRMVERSIQQILDTIYLYFIIKSICQEV